MRLFDTTLIPVGNEEYAGENGESFTLGPLLAELR